MFTGRESWVIDQPYATKLDEFIIFYPASPVPATHDEKRTNEQHSKSDIGAGRLGCVSCPSRHSHDTRHKVYAD